MIEPLGPDSLNPFDPDSFVISAEVHIIDIEPRVSRTLELPVKLNFAQLHEVLQAAFGWTDSHLHQFNVGGLDLLRKSGEFFVMKEDLDDQTEAANEGI
jgi:hypothetical protein